MRTRPLLSTSLYAMLLNIHIICVRCDLTRKYRRFRENYAKIITRNMEAPYHIPDIYFSRLVLHSVRPVSAAWLFLLPCLSAMHRSGFQTLSHSRTNSASVPVREIELYWPTIFFTLRRTFMDTIQQSLIFKIRHSQKWIALMLPFLFICPYHRPRGWHWRRSDDFTCRTPARQGPHC